MARPTLYSEATNLHGPDSSVSSSSLFQSAKLGHGVPTQAL